MISRNLLGTLLMFGFAASSSAQGYECTENGRTFKSERPCATTKIRAYGPRAIYSPPTSPLPSAPKAADHIQYLSPSCASISEAIRTGPARGVRYDGIRVLQEEYRQKCSLEDQDARDRVQRDQTVRLQAQVAERQNGLMEKQQARELSDRCSAMRDAIAMRRKREAELDAKAIESLRGIERTYNGVCLTR